MYKFLMYEGGVYRLNELIEKIEDLGGYILQSTKFQNELILTIAIPEEDEHIIKKIAEERRGELREGALIGTEILLVSPSISEHHLPHPTCDIAEYLRRNGAFTSILSLGRGVGRRISQISAVEKRTIGEYDASVFVLGNFEDCIKQKTKLFEDSSVTVIVTGGPESCDLECQYVGKIGRRVTRMRKVEDQKKLDMIVKSIVKCIEERRREIAEDPLSIDPIELKQQLESLDIKPTILRLDGLRIKLPYDECAERIIEMPISQNNLIHFAKVCKSFAGNVLIKILPESAVS